MTNDFQYFEIPCLIEWNRDLLHEFILPDKNYWEFYRNLTSQSLESLSEEQKKLRVVLLCVEGEFHQAFQEYQQVPAPAEGSLEYIAHLKFKATLASELGDSVVAQQLYKAARDAHNPSLFQHEHHMQMSLQRIEGCLDRFRSFQEMFDFGDRPGWRFNPIIDHLQKVMLSEWEEESLETLVNTRESSVRHRGGQPHEVAYLNASLTVAYACGDVEAAHYIRTDFAQALAVHQSQDPDPQAIFVGFQEIWRARNEQLMAKYLDRFLHHLGRYAQLQQLVLKDRPITSTGVWASRHYATLLETVKYCFQYLTDEALSQLTKEFIKAYAENRTTAEPSEDTPNQPGHHLVESYYRSSRLFVDTLATINHLDSEDLQQLVTWFLEDRQNFEMLDVLVQHDWTPEQLPLARQVARVLVEEDIPSNTGIGWVNLAQQLRLTYPELASELNAWMISQITGENGLSEGYAWYFQGKMDPELAKPVKELVLKIGAGLARFIPSIVEGKIQAYANRNTNMRVWAHLIRQYQSVLPLNEVLQQVTKVVQLASQNDALALFYKTELYNAVASAGEVLKHDRSMMQFLLNHSASLEKARDATRGFFDRAQEVVKMQLAFLKIKLAAGVTFTQEDLQVVMEGFTAKLESTRADAVGVFKGLLATHPDRARSLLPVVPLLMDDSSPQVRSQASALACQPQIISDPFYGPLVQKHLLSLLESRDILSKYHILSSIQRHLKAFVQQGLLADFRFAIESSTQSAHSAIRYTATEILNALDVDTGETGES
ncbi:hypothetical protein [Deinococcus roseus]|uniref:Uncharacterized protein n=1 Tax=Deinococcus roseus TaxID=392414 RepID=A0ABQ2D2Y8_9DEIO|nr:hypothetical protein [Deinococcus roseus]GGJ43949.1 hypothetical protein GCM10008938_32760 [Deinococcus roseus]